MAGPCKLRDPIDDFRAGKEEANEDGDRAYQEVWHLVVGAGAGVAAAGIHRVGQDLRKITFRYSWILYGHAPAYYYAKDLGLWEKEGLDVTILTGKGSGTSVKLMGAEQDHFGTADYGTMMKGVVAAFPSRGFRRAPDPPDGGGDSRQTWRHDAGGPCREVRCRHRGRG